MPVMNISKATWEEVKAEEKALRLKFARILQKEHQSGKSLRLIADERGLSHESVRLLILEAQTEIEA